MPRSLGATSSVASTSVFSFLDSLSSEYLKTTSPPFGWEVRLLFVSYLPQACRLPPFLSPQQHHSTQLTLSNSVSAPSVISSNILVSDTSTVLESSTASVVQPTTYSIITVTGVASENGTTSTFKSIATITSPSVYSSLTAAAASKLVTRLMSFVTAIIQIVPALLVKFRDALLLFYPYSLSLLRSPLGSLYAQQLQAR